MTESVWCIYHFWPDSNEAAPCVILRRTLNAAKETAKQLVRQNYDYGDGADEDDGFPELIHAHDAEIDAITGEETWIDLGDCGLWIFPNTLQDSD